MKNLILTLLLSFLALSLAAQTGLLGLSFGDSRAVALTKLAEQGFTVDSAEGPHMNLSSADSSRIASLELSFYQDADKLAAWAIGYAGDYPNVETEIVGLLQNLHGEDYEYDNEVESYYWDLGEIYYVTASFGWDYKTFWVEYRIDY